MMTILHFLEVELGVGFGAMFTDLLRTPRFHRLSPRLLPLRCAFGNVVVPPPIIKPTTLSPPLNNPSEASGVVLRARAWCERASERLLPTERPSRPLSSCTAPLLSIHRARRFVRPSVRPAAAAATSALTKKLADFLVRPPSAVVRSVHRLVVRARRLPFRCRRR